MSGEQIICPGLCSICPSPAGKPCPKVAVRAVESVEKPIDHNGRELFVSQGLWGDKWGVFYRRTASGGLHRVKSPALPMVATREEAERNLAAYLAKKKGVTPE